MYLRLNNKCLGNIAQRSAKIILSGVEMDLRKFRKRLLIDAESQEVPFYPAFSYKI